MRVPRSVLRSVVRIGVRPTLGPNVPVRWQRRVLDALARVAVLPRGTEVTHLQLGDRPAELIRPPDADNTRAVLYLHGGGYTLGSFVTHRALAAHLAASARAPVYVLDYRLAPEHGYPAAVDDAFAAFDELLATGFVSEHVAVAGDSAGAGLALALALRLRALGRSQPAALGLISPWTDLTLGNVRDDRSDPMLRTAWLRRCAARYAGTNLTAGEVSPGLADLAGLPPIIVHCGADEILRPDIERLVERARAAGVHVRFRILDRMWHVAHLQAGLMTEATSAVEEIGITLRDTTKPESDRPA
jgi:monoterpene epsilon-lactone hydrolase